MSLETGRYSSVIRMQSQHQWHFAGCRSPAVSAEIGVFTINICIFSGVRNLARAAIDGGSRVIVKCPPSPLVPKRAQMNCSYRGTGNLVPNMMTSEAHSTPLSWQKAGSIPGSSRSRL